MVTEKVIYDKGSNWGNNKKKKERKKESIARVVCCVSHIQIPKIRKKERKKDICLEQNTRQALWQLRFEPWDRFFNTCLCVTAKKNKQTKNFTRKYYIVFLLFLSLAHL